MTFIFRKTLCDLLYFQTAIYDPCGQLALLWLSDTIALHTKTDLHSEAVTAPAYSLAYHRHSKSSGKFRILCCVKIRNAVISVYRRTRARENIYERGEKGRAEKRWREWQIGKQQVEWEMRIEREKETDSSG